MLAIIISLVAIAAVLYYRRIRSGYRHWEKRGIPSLPGYFPFGSYEKRSDTKKFQGLSMDQFYKKMANHKYFGYYEHTRPIFVARDPEMLRLVLTKEFSHFRDRLSFDMPKHDPIIHYQLFTLRGDNWRALRAKLTPIFTSGKMKAMFPLFVDCAQALNTLLWSREGSDIDVKDVIPRFTTDVICSCAFGLQTNTIAEPDHPLRKAAADFIDVGNTIFFRLKFIVGMLLPNLLPLRRLRFTPKNVEDYVMKLISDTIEYREKNVVTRNDFLDLLIQLKNKGSLREEGDTDVDEAFEVNLGVMAAQCFLFFIAGFETSSSVQSYCLYELALHQDIQQKLREEIQEKIEIHGGVTYQAVNEMKYLHMVVSESMRKYPTLTILLRSCVEPIELPDGGRLEKGDHVTIPVWSLHHDPQHFPNPDNFDPERFSPENEDNIKPYTYLPFGEGPRMCIGNRFGLLQTKVGIITVIRNFQVLPCEKTSIPLKLVRSYRGMTTTEGPIFLKLESIRPKKQS